MNLFHGRADIHLRSPKPRKPTLKAPLPPRRGFRFCRGPSPGRRHAVPVPELTSVADIKLNTRLSLRTSQTSLAWLQSRRLAAPQYGLRTARSGVASCPRSGPALHNTSPFPRQRPRGRYAAWPDAGTVPLLARFRRRRYNCEAIETFPKPKKPVGLSRRASYAVTKSSRALGAIRDCREDTEQRLKKCRCLRGVRLRRPSPCFPVWKNLGRATRATGSTRVGATVLTNIATSGWSRCAHI